jgi:peptide chain release factor subunit 1
MILSRHLHELSQFKAPSAAVLSVYLDLEGGRKPESLLSALKRSSGAAIPSEDFAALERGLDAPSIEGARGLAAFSCAKLGLLRLCPLPEPVRPRLFLETAPALRPLLNLVDQYQRYGVVLLGTRRMRVLEFFMGRARELDEHCLRASELPTGRLLYLKAATGRIETLSRQLGFQRLIVCAPEGLEKGFVDQLPRALQDNLILDPGLGDLASLAETRLRIADADFQARKVREQVLAHRLLDAAGKTSVVGLSRVLEAVEQGRARTVLYRDGFAKLGRCCTGCGRLSLTQIKCVWCSAPTQTLFNLAQELADRALAQGAEVFRLSSQTPLDNLGSIGAELRPAGVPVSAASTLPAAAALKDSPSLRSGGR